MEFLFGKTIMRESAELGEQIVKLFEEADEVEGTEMVANKKSLASALQAMGIPSTEGNSSVKVNAGFQSATLTFDDDAAYRECLSTLSSPDNIHKLAEMGWVMTHCGDQAMANEKPEFKVGFIEIATAQTGEADKPDEKIKAIIKKAQEFATEPMDNDTGESNPVERETGKPDVKLSGKTKGIGKTADGANPEGKPKGSTGKVKESAQARVDRILSNPPLQEMTSASGIPPVESPMGLGGMRSRQRRPNAPYKHSMTSAGEAVRKHLGLK
jgi:hypothetical protein